MEVRRRCAEAVPRGKQVWSARAYAAYRLALEAPAALAGPVVAEGDDRHTVGPLWEVAASTHTWEELEPHLPPGPQRELVAQERVLRGEDLRGEDVDDHVLGLPLRLQTWEPAYPVATYRADGVETPSPALPTPGRRLVPDPTEGSGEGDAGEALYELVRPWVEESNGIARVASVAGGAADAAAACGGVTLVLLDPPIALAWMCWAGASGGAHGRRRGGAVGRFNAWWALAALAVAEWPPGGGELAAVADTLEWARFTPARLPPGWEFHLAVGGGGEAWAVAATDAVADHPATSAEAGPAP